MKTLKYTTLIMIITLMISCDESNHSQIIDDSQLVDFQESAKKINDTMKLYGQSFSIKTGKNNSENNIKDFKSINELENWFKSYLEDTTYLQKRKLALNQAKIIDQLSHELQSTNDLAERKKIYENYKKEYDFIGKSTRKIKVD